MKRHKKLLAPFFYGFLILFCCPVFADEVLENPYLGSFFENKADPSLDVKYEKTIGEWTSLIESFDLLSDEQSPLFDKKLDLFWKYFPTHKDDIEKLIALLWANKHNFSCLNKKELKTRAGFLKLESEGRSDYFFLKNKRIYSYAKRKLVNMNKLSIGGQRLENLFKSMTFIGLLNDFDKSSSELEYLSAVIKEGHGANPLLARQNENDVIDELIPCLKKYPKLVNCLYDIRKASSVSISYPYKSLCSHGIPLSPPAEHLKVLRAMQRAIECAYFSESKEQALFFLKQAIPFLEKYEVLCFGDSKSPVNGFLGTKIFCLDKIGFTRLLCIKHGDVDSLRRCDDLIEKIRRTAHKNTVEYSILGRFIGQILSSEKTSLPEKIDISNKAITLDGAKDLSPFDGHLLSGTEKPVPPERWKDIKIEYDDINNMYLKEYK